LLAETVSGAEILVDPDLHSHVMTFRGAFVGCRPGRVRYGDQCSRPTELTRKSAEKLVRPSRRDLGLRGLERPQRSGGLRAGCLDRNNTKPLRRNGRRGV